MLPVSIFDMNRILLEASHHMQVHKMEVNLSASGGYVVVRYICCAVMNMNSSTSRLLIITGILTFWIIYSPSPFQKGGVDIIYYTLIPAIMLVCSMICILPNRELKIIERLILSILVPLVALIISTVFLMELFIQTRYSDKTWALWENDERILTNSVYYSITVVLMIGIIKVYKRIKLLATKPKLR